MHVFPFQSWRVAPLLQLEGVAPCQVQSHSGSEEISYHHRLNYTYSFHRWGQEGPMCPQTGTETLESPSRRNQNCIRRQWCLRVCTQSPAQSFFHSRSLVFCSRLLEMKSTRHRWGHEAHPGCGGTLTGGSTCC